MAPEKMVWEGVSTTPGEFRYPAPAMRADNITVKEWKPTSDINLGDGVIRMKLLTEANEIIRFPPNPFVVKFTAKYDNPGFVAGGAPDVAAAEHLVRAQSLLPPIFLDPGLGGAAFFSKVVVKIKETYMDAPQLGEFAYLYQSINRRFASAAQLEKKYCTTFPRIPTTEDRVFTTAALMKGTAMEKAAASLTFDSYNDSKSICLSFGMDGMFPLDQQSNILAAIMDTVIPNGFLRPKTEIHIDLHKRHPIDSAIDSTRCHDRTYFEGVDADHAKPDIKVELQDLTILYESVQPDPVHLPALTKGLKTYWVDVPKFYHKEIAGGISFISDELTVPEGVKAILVFWVPQHQLVYDPAKKTNLHARFRFPSNSTDLRVKLTGKDGLLLQDGFVNVGSGNGNIEASSKAYHWMLGRMGVWSLPFEKLFPRSVTTTKNAYDQLIFINTSKFVIKEPITLTVTSKFGGTGSPQKHRLCMLTLQQYRYTQTENGEWKFEVQI